MLLNICGGEMFLRNKENITNSVVLRIYLFLTLSAIRQSVLLCLLFLSLLVSGCATAPDPIQPGVQGFEENDPTINQLNAQLQGTQSSGAREYRLGTGDRVELIVFQAKELSREYQINSKGDLQMPLVGGIPVGGLTADEAQTMITQQLADKVMLNPQVSLAIVEYASSEISVTGAVQSPDLYKVKEGRNPFEMLTMAGGLNKDAGRYMHITTRKRNDETQAFESVRIVVDLDAYLNPLEADDFTRQQELRELVLLDGDNVYIPEAGLVYIDGAVRKPGSYKIPNDTTIFSLIALAGGAEWSSTQQQVKVVRKVDGRTNIDKVSLTKIRNGKEPNFKLEPGDLVVVGRNPIKQGVEAFFKYGLRLAIFF